MISKFDWLYLIPARIFLEKPKTIPNEEGVYYVFIEGGRHLLAATQYFQLSRHEPLAHKNAVHLYTGATERLRHRLRCHLHGDCTESGLRKTLVGVELARKAISATRTPGCSVKDKKGLNHWLAQNAHFAFVPCRDAPKRELDVLRTTASPLNIRNARVPTYAGQLLAWRAEHFPHDGSF